jgi:membrane protein YdbS with pleckstrin-like domain
MRYAALAFLVVGAVLAVQLWPDLVRYRRITAM